MKLIELNEIFDIKYGNKLDLNKMSIVSPNSKHSVAFIARTRQNNGIIAYVEKIAGVSPYPSGSITVALGGSVLSSFVQYGDFYTAQNVAVLSPKLPVVMQEEIKIYYCIAINTNAFRYSTCGREANKTLKKILLPDLSEIPEYVKTTNMPKYTLNKSVNNQIIFSLNTSKWKSFRYEDLFKIDRGIGPRKQNIEYGKIPFVTSKDTNNGILIYVNYIPTHSGNTIGVNRNGSVAEAFYQEIPFCSTEDVHILNPKFKMNKYIAMFLITLIKKERYRYCYGRKWGIERMNKSIIKLPAKNDGCPDWNYMENYIKALPYSASI